MLKKYSAKSCVSVSVVLPTGGTTHVTFTPRSTGGSVYYTVNPNIQTGLETHPKFGKLFSLDKEQPKESAKTASKTAASAPAKETTKPKEPRTIEMSIVEDAKDYLATKFGISRSKLRTKAECEAAALANGFKIIWKG